MTLAPAPSKRFAFGSPQDIAKVGVVVTLVLLVLFGWARYDNFLSPFNILSFLRYNAMFGLIALGMCFVIVTGGIDLSVGAVAALSSVVAALASPYGLAAGVAAGTATGLVAGLLNGLIITRLSIAPFIATLATMLAAYGSALLLADNQSVSASYDTAFTEFGQGDLLGLPVPALVMMAAYLVGWLVLERTRSGRRVLAVGGGEDASRLMGLDVDRLKLGVYLASGALAGLAGVVLAAQFGAGQPTEGVGWELFAIASVVVGGTLLTGGSGSVGATLAGAMLLALLFNLLNFENGKGWISLSAYWQSVIRGLFPLLFVLLQAKIAKTTDDF
ncbi:sugar ABC transporter permease [Aureimonas sp. Leaf454]|uniref:ABC transporter permease n=1 Tax=Aureimonas sp. Leaf454 TaxID=1736381 RepID=UPI0006F8E272|nr:ABC transporter permease [Aureimonas sp. Leaf454]KQT44580.1 sugar ABC transporter permease [Aureimonas sp. Leaf454]